MGVLVIVKAIKHFRFTDLTHCDLCACITAAVLRRYKEFLETLKWITQR